MGEDKSFLNYHGKPQCYHLYEMLEPYCAEVFISCNAEQSHLIMHPYKSLEDREIYADRGPATGVLSAFSKYSSNNFLVIGCDYPFLSHTDVALFLNSIPGDAVAAAFYDDQVQSYQPVLAWYSAEAGRLLQKTDSLKQLLEKVNAFKYKAVNLNATRSVDTKHENDEVMRTINYNYQ